MPDETIPYYLRPAERPTIVTGLRIHKDQQSRLVKDFNGRTSLLVRILLDAYLNGELPELEKKFKDLPK